jgi:hypothetical protein
MNGVYLVPPMDDEPPEDFITFVAVHLADLQREAARLTGGPQHAEEVYPDALADVAGHWRRLCLRRRLTHRDTAGQYLTQRLNARAKHWREEQIYEVEVQLIRDPVRVGAQRSSIALRKAAVLPGTMRVPLRPVAEASIAWGHAWRRARWRRIGRAAAAVFVVFVSLLQVLPAVTT